MGTRKKLLVLGLFCLLQKCVSLADCPDGLIKKNRECVDDDECQDSATACGKNATCFNTYGSFYCQCVDGYENIKGAINFTGLTGECRDINECQKQPDICGPNARCDNQHGNFTCICHRGYAPANNSIRVCVDINECDEAQRRRKDICGGKGTCENVHGSYWCKCQEGYTNYGNKGTPCSELDCNIFKADTEHSQSLGGLADILSMMRNSCLALSKLTAESEGKTDGVALLEKLLTATDAILAPQQLNSSNDVSGLLDTVENSIRIIGPQLKGNRTTIESAKTGAEIAVQRGETRPEGPIHLNNGNESLDTDWTTAAGEGAYPGFALAALISYKNLESSVNRSFDGLTGFEKDGVDPTFEVFSRVVSVVVSNPSPQNLSRPVNITFRHLDREKSTEVRYICAYWTEEGAWSTDGCYQQRSTITHTVCTCEHLSSFAVLMARYPIEHSFGLIVMTKIGLIISLLCLILCILTFKFCRSIQGTRTTIHLHLCVCLFLADLIFLVGISKTKPVGGCRFVAAMLHFFFLGVFSWMLLEGVQLYRMVVLVFNATIRPLYLYLSGYGAPFVILIISAITRPEGYGTDHYCWLSLDNGFIWSFFGPVCFIIILNIFFFIITVWKLAQKFTSLNPDLSKLHKIRAFTVTAVAQMCILGLMWVFGAFLFENGPTAVAYIFTILNSLQGALIFVMHCLLSKQVRDEYAHFLSCICTTQKKRYSDLSSTNPSMSQSQASRSGPNSGESQI